jgi:hypothetical protein
VTPEIYVTALFAGGGKWPVSSVVLNWAAALKQ